MSKSKRLIVRVTEEELEVYRAAAGARAESVSEWARDILWTVAMQMPPRKP